MAKKRNRSFRGTPSEHRNEYATARLEVEHAISAFKRAKKAGDCRGMIRAVGRIREGAGEMKVAARWALPDLVRAQTKKARAHRLTPAEARASANIAEKQAAQGCQRRR